MGFFEAGLRKPKTYAHKERDKNKPTHDNPPLIIMDAGNLPQLRAPRKFLVPDDFISISVKGASLVVVHPRQGSVLGFVSPLVSPARKLAPTQPSLFSRFAQETVSAQASTGFLTQAPRLFPPDEERSILFIIIQEDGRLKRLDRRGLPRTTSPTLQSA
jgi:hypothetical protein